MRTHKPKDIQKRFGDCADAYEKAKKAALKGLELAKEGKIKEAKAEEKKAKYWWDRFEKG